MDFIKTFVKYEDFCNWKKVTKYLEYWSVVGSPSQRATQFRLCFTFMMFLYGDEWDREEVVSKLNEFKLTVALPKGWEEIRPEGYPHVKDGSVD